MARIASKWQRIATVASATLMAAALTAGPAASAQAMPRTTTTAKVTKAKVVKKVTTKKVAVKTVAAKTTAAVKASTPARPPATPASLGALATLALAPYVSPAKLGTTLAFQGSHPSYLGLFESGKNVVNVYVRDGESLQTLTYVLAHELGHSIDVNTMSWDQRAQWAADRGFNVNAWWPSQSGASDWRSGAEDFAESFAACTAKTGLSFDSKLGGYPTAAECQLVFTLAAAGH